MEGLKQQSVCLARVKPWIQTPVPPKQEIHTASQGTYLRSYVRTSQFGDTYTQILSIHFPSAWLGVLAHW
jgi:hypothetical protein